MMPVEIDASYGGQVFRTALTLAALLTKPVKITNIRKNRPKPGLKIQHLYGLKALAKLTNAEVIGAKLGSQNVVFRPKSLVLSNFKVELPTAGSISLVLQTIMPLVAIKPLHGLLYGGTDVPFAPPMDYYEEILYPALKKLGFEFRHKVLFRGYYPEGKGQVEWSGTKKKGKNIEFVNRGQIKRVKVKINGQRLSKEILERMKKHALKLLLENGIEAEIGLEYREKGSIGCNFQVFGIFENGFCGFNGLCKKGKRAEEIVEETLKNFFDFLNSSASIDGFLADQLIVFAAIQKGKHIFKAYKITEHTKAVMKTLKSFGFERIRIKDRVVEIDGGMDGIGKNN